MTDFILNKLVISERIFESCSTEVKEVLNERLDVEFTLCCWNEEIELINGTAGGLYTSSTALENLKLAVLFCGVETHSVRGGGLRAHRKTVAVVDLVVWSVRVTREARLVFGCRYCSGQKSCFR